MKKILVLQANPNKKSFGASLAKTYRDSALDSGHSVDYFDVVDIKFDYNLLPGKKLEPSLKKQQELIKWADHVVIVSPVWWMNFPACMKAYIDRVLTGGFAFKYPHHNPLLRMFLPEPLLKGKTLRLISTQDSPRFVYWLLGHTFQLAYRFALFSYCGFKYRRTALCSVRSASTYKRDKWNQKISSIASKGI